MGGWVGGWERRTAVIVEEATEVDKEALGSLWAEVAHSHALCREEKGWVGGWVGEG